MVKLQQKCNLAKSAVRNVLYFLMSTDRVSIITFILQLINLLGKAIITTINVFIYKGLPFMTGSGMIS